jgi:hypothetical protein
VNPVIGCAAVGPAFGGNEFPYKDGIYLPIFYIRMGRRGMNLIELLVPGVHNEVDPLGVLLLSCCCC